MTARQRRSFQNMAPLTGYAATVRLGGVGHRTNVNAGKGHTVPHARRTTERLSAFSDAVFAVLISVLVLELRPPELPTFKALLSLWPTWLSYAVSYLFIAIVWANHHHLMRYAPPPTRGITTMHVRSGHDCKRWYLRPMIDYLVD